MQPLCPSVKGAEPMARHGYSCELKPNQSPPPKDHSYRVRIALARVNAFTLAAPQLLKTAAVAPTVLPVVHKSSTSNTVACASSAPSAILKAPERLSARSSGSMP